VLLVAVPVTVIGYVPVIVEASTVKVSVELPPAVTDAGLKEAFTPAGSVPVLMAMLSALPLVIVVEMVEVPVPPCATETELGFALIEKSFVTGAVIVNETVVECVALGPVPVIVTVYVPGVALPAPSVSVELLPALTDAGLNEAVAPEGTPLALSETVCAAPLVTAVAIVEVALPFCVAETALGFVVIEKSSGGGAAPQPGSLNVPIRVRQLKEPFAGRYSFAYQKVQPSTGSMLIEL